MTQWQPIETAPKDGTWVLIAGGYTGEDDYMGEGVEIERPVVAFFDADQVVWRGDKDEDQVGCWLFCFWDGDWRTGYNNPTHWMPLPELAA